MSKIVWDKTGERLYETGVKNGVLYPMSLTGENKGKYPKGVAWNGLTAVNESPSGAEEEPLYADDIKYGAPRSNEEFGGTIEAYTYPDEFGACDGSAEIASGVKVGQQKRNPFGFCYKTTVGNDVEGNDYGYKLHLVYGATANPSEKEFATINDSPEAVTFSWEFTTTPVEVPGHKPTAHIEIDSTKADSTKLAALEEILYGKDPTTTNGNDGVDARLPLPAEIITLMATTEEDSQ